MGDDDHRHFFIRELADDLQDFARELGVERTGRLVEKENGRLEGKRAGYGDALLLSAGKLARIGVRAVLKIHFPEKLHRLLVHFFLRALLNRDRCVHNVLQDRVMRKKVELLKYKSEVPFHLIELGMVQIDRLALVPCSCGCLSHIPDLTGINRLEECCAAKERALSRPAGADHADDLTGVDVKSYVLQYFKSSE